MNFQKLAKVETADQYLDTAFNRAREAADKTREKAFAHRFAKSKAVETDKVAAASKSMLKNLQSILTSFPSFDQLDPFYQSLVKLSLEFGQLKQALGAVNWAAKRIESLTIQSKQNLKQCQDMAALNKYRREFFGRMMSYVHQIKDAFAVLERARVVMKSFPNVKTSLPTVCICGFPNVGKSTLLSKITTAKPEIREYAFTTKSLNLGYIQIPTKKIQVIDTPGTLARFNKMNSIEQQAYLAIKHCADLLIYIYDLSEPYPLEQQHKLFEQLKQWKKPMILYLSKTDILDEKVVGTFRTKEMVCSADDIQTALLRYPFPAEDNPIPA